MNPKINLPPNHSDERGFIQVLLHEHNGSVVVIDTVPHVERANHYHKDDYHYCYVSKRKYYLLREEGWFQRRPYKIHI